MRQKGLSPGACNVYIRTVNAFLNWLHLEHGYAKIKLGKVKEEQKIIKTISGDGFAALLRLRPKTSGLARTQLAALLICDTGLRISEVLGLRKGDVNLEQCTVTVIGKGNKERIVPISQEMRKRLYLCLREHVAVYLFATGSGRQVSVRNFERDFNRLCKEAGIKGVRTSPHTLRHSFAVHYLRNGGNLEFLRRLHGHSSLVTTQKYIRSLGIDDLTAVHNQLSPLARR